MMFIGFWLGAFLGLANVLLVALGMSNADPFIHGTRRPSRPRWRSVVLATPASAVVAMLGTLFDLEHFILVACTPTLAACAILERATREPTVVPSAYVR